MPKSRNKHSRAAMRARSRRRPNQRSSRWFYITVAVLCLVGVIGVVAASGMLEEDNASAAPQPGDHWHAAFAVNVCGEWLTNPPEFEAQAGNSNVRSGIHTHGDGFIHIHPFASSEGGDNATLGRFLDYGGWSASEDSIDVWTGPSSEPNKTEWKNGDRCPNAAGEAGKGEPGRVVWAVDCKTETGNPSDYKLKDQVVIAIGFLPKGEELEAPPNAASAPSNDGTEVAPLNKESCTPSAQNNPGIPEATATTVPGTTATSTSPAGQ